MIARYILFLILTMSAVPAFSQTSASETEQPDSPKAFDTLNSTSNAVLPSAPPQEYANRWPRLVLDSEIGSAASLGYELPSTAFGPLMEVPLGNSWEVQILSLYSPDRKLITHDGQSLKLEGSAIRFLNGHIGVIGGLERDWLWTSQFGKKLLEPSAGTVLRNEAIGRLYLTYLFPTGCVWATSGNPCTIQSNRLQGGEFRQEARLRSHLRLGFRGGVYHFCDQGDPKEPQAGRTCHLGFTAYLDFGIEFHLRQTSRSKEKAATNHDNF
jgi:hypothetical protein